MKVIIYIVIGVLCILSAYSLFETYTSSPYSQTNIYQVLMHDKYGQAIITCVVDYDKMQLIMKEISQEYNLSSKNFPFPTNVTYKRYGYKEEFLITYNDSEVFDMIKRVLSYHNDDGLLDITGDEVGFALYDRDFYIFANPYNKEEIIKILEKNGLKEKSYLVKSRYPHYHIMKKGTTNNPLTI